MNRNRLANATSPYLLQHADNPVDWHPWDEEALALAREHDRPILLSIGYSACHWCHVMAHESFEEPATAELMNRLFVNIKVDREERPDLDRLYQTAHQLMARRPGGWPLTMFLTADEHTPFFGGTYFPDRPRHGMPAFTEVLQRVADHYRDNRDEVRRQGRAVQAVFPRLEPEPGAPDAPLDDAPIAKAREQLAAHFDADHGGFGSAPKFPHPSNIGRLLRHWRHGAAGSDPDVQALFMATLTLRRMADGGIYDHLRGGFCRYSVDRAWRIPHFEKMLCDNAQLLSLYAQTWRATGDEAWRNVARETADWVIAEMQSPEGGYWSSLDADSEGEEGRFYVWARDEVRALLDNDAYAAFAPAYGLEDEPNFEGRWHLWRAVDDDALARRLALPVSTVRARLDAARSRLLDARDRRVRPGRDDKVLTGWNGLMIAGMADAARALDEPRYARSATAALEYVRAALWRDGRLLATARDGRAHLNACLDDHAWLLAGTLSLLECEFRPDWLDFATALAELLLARFEDRERGGFFYTSDDHETLIHRARVFTDDACPSGNGVAALALQRLGCLLVEPRYLAAAERTLRAAHAALDEYAHAHATLLDALEEHLHPPQIVVLRGDENDVVALREVATAVYAPRRRVYVIPPGAPLPPALAGRHAERTPVAWVCEGMTCAPPVYTPEALAERLTESR